MAKQDKGKARDVNLNKTERLKDGKVEGNKGQRAGGRPKKGGDNKK